jgi:hypothetical protein
VKKLVRRAGGKARSFCLLVVTALVAALPDTSGKIQGRIKGFAGPWHFSSEGPFGNWKSIVATTVYSRLSGVMEDGVDVQIFEKHG